MEKPGDAYIEEMAKSFWLSKGIDATRITETDMYRAGFDRCWNTHVVPLEQKISDLMIENTRVVEGDRYRQDYFKRVTSGLESENKALREEINALNVDIQSYRNGHEANAKRYNDLLIERNKLKEEIDRLKAELKNANSALDNISDMGHA